MADQRSESCCFQSRFAGGWVTAAQYLSESMCDRKARVKKTQLPAKFWEASPVWKREFRQQILHANALLKVYTIAAIIKALRTPPGKKIFSLGAKFLNPLVKEEQIKIDQQEALKQAAPKTEPAPERKAEPEAPRPHFNHQQSTKSKLRDLD